MLGLICFFVYWPLVEAVRYSFTAWNGLTAARWVGGANYSFLWHQSVFRGIVKTNVLLLFGIVVWVIVPFVLALVLQGLRGAGVFRAVFLIPHLLSPIIVGGLFRVILAPGGPINVALRHLGLGFIALGWLTDAHVVLLAVVGVICWALLGTGVLFYSAGLAAIPMSHVEAATMEGASWLQLAWHIYRPALRRVTRFWVLILTVATVIGLFPWIFGLTQGGPGFASTTIDYQMYNIGILGGQYGMACAIAVVGVGLVLLVLLVQAAWWRRPA